jgi:hypothetical protein
MSSLPSFPSSLPSLKFSLVLFHYTSVPTFLYASLLSFLFPPTFFPPSVLPSEASFLPCYLLILLPYENFL